MGDIAWRDPPGGHSNFNLLRERVDHALDALPAISKGSRPVPSFAGVCVNPMPRSSMYASMLSQVSLASSIVSAVGLLTCA